MSAPPPMLPSALLDGHSVFSRGSAGSHATDPTIAASGKATNQLEIGKNDGKTWTAPRAISSDNRGKGISQYSKRVCEKVASKGRTTYKEIISGLQNFDKDNVASCIIAAEKGGATHVDIACDTELVKLAASLTSLPICVSSVDPESFLPAVQAGAHMVEIGNYDSFYDMGIQYSPEQILKLTCETRRILPFITLSVTVPHTISLPEQVKLAELLELEGADIIQTEGGKCSKPSKSGVLGLIEKATPTLAAAYSISRAVNIPVMCSSGISSVTAPMALTAGAAGVGVGSAVNKLNDVIAMIAEVRSIAESLRLSSSSRVSEVMRNVRPQYNCTDL